ncbi:heparinase II/III family protein [Streptomyces sp. DSM 44915]|uniref:Heparinase II/III family protein n=1 Tax=Streptomyces chisholmiae TaxID=3075540 RepID=A0ABU2JZZ8_9ACTN|nr:heparinase II/III family protein [Streptomyces sp. DSM 44915]MDT0270397.1 heparinase II/III family protein [Streptomyces sp. DSM 44915]
MPHHRLTDLYPRERLATVLPPPGRWRPLPPAADRAAWGRVPEAARAQALARAAAPLADPSGDGSDADREPEPPARRTRLIAAVTRTLLLGPGAATGELTALVRLICAEPSWRGSPERPGQPDDPAARAAPDVHAAETAALLAHTWLLARDELPADLVATLTAEVRSRVLTPFGAGDVGQPPEPPGQTACAGRLAAQLLPAALLLAADAETLLTAVVRAVRVLDRWLAGVPEDGGGADGIAAWWGSAAAGFEALETLADATGDPAGLALPRLAALARYPVAARIAGPWYVNFGAGPPWLGPVEPGLLFRYGRRVGAPEVAALAATVPPAETPDAGGGTLARLVTPLLDAEWTGAAAGPGPALPRQHWLPDTRLMVARERGDRPDGLFLAATAGHAGPRHPHAAGSFFLAHRGRPVVVEPGLGDAPGPPLDPHRHRERTPQGHREAERGRWWGWERERNRHRERPDRWATGAAWHNLPVVNGVSPTAGAARAAGVAAVLADGSAELSLDLAAGWPPEAGVASWRRTLRLRRAGADGPAEVTVEERWRLTTPPAGGLALHLVTTHPVAVGPTPGSVLLGAPGHRVLLGYDAALFCLAIEERAVADPELAAVWDGRLHRLRLVATVPAVAGHTRLAFRAVEPAPRGDGPAEPAGAAGRRGAGW